MSERGELDVRITAERVMATGDGNMFPAGLSAMAASALSGDGDVADRRLADGRIARLERDPRPGVRFYIEVSEEGGNRTCPVIAFEAQASRPSVYPDDLPFIAGEPVVLGLDSGRRLLAWASPGDRDALVATLIETDTRDGWTLMSETSHWLGVDRYELHGHGRRRLVISASFPSLVELLETELADG